MANYVRDARVAVVTAIVFAIAFGAGVAQWFSDQAPTFFKEGTTIVIGLVGLINIYQSFSAINKLAAAGKPNAVNASPDDAAEPTSARS